ncbi:glycosyltransferase [Paenibacillus chitinolyticus]|uniref:glycosyltransferase n=1 Tax=Paenibacillus chitinolyticus TaxID=79263 RepID=UPI0038707106
MKNIRIMFVITGLGVGGAEMMLYRLVKDLQKKGHSIIVVSLLEGGEIAAKIEQAGVEVVSLKMRNKFAIGSIPKFLKIIKSFRPDIIHSFMFHANVLSRIVSRLTRGPVVISSIRNTVFGGELRESIMRFTDPWSDATTIICKLAAARMIQERIVPEKKLHVIYNGINPEPFICPNAQKRNQIRSSLGISSAEQLILSVGRLEEQKGYPTAIKAAALLAEWGLNFRWIIAGEGILRESLEGLVLEHKLEDRIKFIGVRNDVNELQWAADIYVLSSYWEGLPGVVIEAMAASVPIVCTKVGGAPELVEHEVNGLLCEERNEEDLAIKLKTMLEYPIERRKKMGAISYEKMQREFNLISMVSKNEELYMNLLNRNSEDRFTVRERMG